MSIVLLRPIGHRNFVTIWPVMFCLSREIEISQMPAWGRNKIICSLITPLKYVDTYLTTLNIFSYISYVYVRDIFNL